MTHSYKITGMTCEACQAKVQNLLSGIEGIKDVNIDLSAGMVNISMQKHIGISTLQNALKDTKYRITAIHEQAEEEAGSWLQTYKPVLLIFVYLTVITLLVQVKNGAFNWWEWMDHFMAGFFLVFSFFKLLNLQGFADSYSTYDIIAKKWPFYGKIYAFIELGLGLAYLDGFFPLVVNAITFFVMSISLIGVIQSLLDKKKIRCACLGDVFNLPMSTITIIEDALMIIMSFAMLAKVYILK